MNRFVHIVLAIGLVACGGEPEERDCVNDPGPGCWEDFPPEEPPGSVCNPVTQDGCDTGEKCTWQDVTDTLGRIACVPDGMVAIGESCMLLPPGETAGYDDCAAGAYCQMGTCQEICRDAPDSCDSTTSACSSYSGLFEGAKVSTGLCDFKCEPGSQERLFDGAPSCGGTTERPLGCYGWAWSSMPFDYACTADISNAQHGDTPDPLTPQGGPYLHSCDAGYSPWLAGLGGATADVCLAFCVPGESHSGDTVNLDGVGAFTCAARGATGAAIECRYFHAFEVSPPRDRYNASGICLDMAVFDVPSCRDLSNTTIVDSNGDSTPDTPEHEYWGCAPWSDPE
jgi:hypothetical protein